MRSLKYSPMVIGLVFCLNSLASAVSEIAIPITEFAVIAPPNQPADATVLLSISLPESLLTKTVLHAEILCSVNPVVESDSSLEVAVIPIGVTWNPDDVEWDNSWREMGGNLLDSLMTLHGIQILEGDLPNIEITDMVRRWLDGTYANNGIAIKTPFDSNIHFRVLPLNPDRGELALMRILFLE